MATFLDTDGYRTKEVKLDEWRLPSVMIRELFGDEAEQLREWLAANADATENALYRRIVYMGVVPQISDEAALLKKPASVVRHIAKEIQELGNMGAKAAEQAEKN